MGFIRIKKRVWKGSLKSGERKRKKKKKKGKEEGKCIEGGKRVEKGRKKRWEEYMPVIVILADQLLSSITCSAFSISSTCGAVSTANMHLSERVSENQSDH